MKHLRRLAVVVIAVGFLMSLAAMAEDDPPSRVARVDYLSGQVSIQPGGVNDWVAANVNRPLTTSDRIWADKDSRAELQLPRAAIRIDSNTSMTISNLSDATTQLELDQGTMNLRITHLYRGEIYEIDTPNMAFTVTKAGNYRFDVDHDGDMSFVTVWKGEGEATGNGPTVRVRAHERVRFSGGRSLEYQVSQAPPRDGFDDWALVRDKRLDDTLSARYVSPDVVGYQDLDEYGSWRVVPTYGAIWAPTYVSPGWAPYRFGHWVWIDPWGWTWVDDAPWGFAPFHYGRWVYYQNYWGWCPGPIYASPIWAPALVAWVGGPSWGISFGFGFGGGYGWFPLGWGEPYIPWYGASRHYWRQVNVSNTYITNTTIINNYYNNPNAWGKIRHANFKVPGGVTAAPRQALLNSQAINRVGIAVPKNQLNNANVIGRPTGLDPVRHTLLGSGADKPAARPPASAASHPVVTRLNPPAARPNRFANPETGPGRAGGRPVVANEVQPRIGNPATNSPGAAVRQPSYPRPPVRSADDRPMNTTPGARNDVPRGADNRAMGDNGPGRYNGVPRPPERTADAVRPTMDTPGRSAVPRPSADVGGGNPSVAPTPGRRAINDSPGTPPVASAEAPRPRAMDSVPHPGNTSVAPRSSYTPAPERGYDRGPATSAPARPSYTFPLDRGNDRGPTPSAQPRQAAPVPPPNRVAPPAATPRSDGSPGRSAYNRGYPAPPYAGTSGGPARTYPASESTYQRYSPAPSRSSGYQSSPARSYGGGYRSTASYGYSGGSRSTPNYSNGGYRSTPSYGGGYRSAPNYGGGYRPAPNYSGGYRSAPSGGAYRSAPGGGYRSAPSRAPAPSAPPRSSYSGTRTRP